MKTNFSLLRQPIMKNSYKVDLVTKMLSHVPDLGWTWDALSKAALNSKKMKSHSEEELQTIFDNKISTIIGIFNDKLDEEMFAIFNPENNKNLGVTQTVKALVLSRLRASENYKSIIKTSLFFMAQPGNAYEALNQLMKTSNKIWEIAGDTSRGRNFYSKRLILAGVYSSTLAYWLAKETRSIDGSEDFLDKGLMMLKTLAKYPNSLSKSLRGQNRSCAQ